MKGFHRWEMLCLALQKSDKTDEISSIPQLRLDGHRDTKIHMGNHHDIVYLPSQIKLKITFRINFIDTFSILASF